MRIERPTSLDILALSTDGHVVRVEDVYYIKAKRVLMEGKSCHIIAEIEHNKEIVIGKHHFRLSENEILDLGFHAPMLLPIKVTT